MKPKKLHFRIISPSQGVLNLFPNRVKNGIGFLERNGHTVSFGKNSFGDRGYISGTVNERVDDLHEAFLDQSVDIVMAGIGGYNSNQLLEQIDYELIYKNPKIFCGYSDNTALLLAIYAKTKIPVFHGPCFVTEICEYPNPFDYTWNNFIRAVDGQSITWENSKYTTSEFIDWFIQEEKMQVRITHPTNGWEFVKTGNGEGKLVGGNLSTIINNLGTDYLPVNIFDKAILFIEECDCTTAKFDSMLYSLKLHGVLDQINGLVIGRFDKIEDQDKKLIYSTLKDITKKHCYPIVADVDIGHTDPMITIPIGRRGFLKCSSDQEILFGVK